MSENPMAKQRRVRRSGKAEEDPTMETRILEGSVRKILSLLAIGFGEAGAEVRHCPHTSILHCSCELNGLQELLSCSVQTPEQLPAQDQRAVTLALPDR